MGVSISFAKVRENGRIEARWIILGFHTLFFGQVKKPMAYCTYIARVGI